MSVPVRTHKTKPILVTNGAVEVPVDPNYPHTFVSVYPTFANGEPRTFLDGISGEFKVEYLTATCPHYQQGKEGDITAKTPKDVSVSANLLKVKVTPSGVSGATHFVVAISQNIT
ncbi:tail protein [Vibrio phage vB_VpaS_MAR10]|uniref:DUF7265 domain-containing protein n=1 Tax=Vibrio phage vB_VpaS_MAR10 TaxID=1229755 RepID=K7R2E4_9CAUD|nr:tail protein [Vibrio phage vB_VpaS_MAR10]AFV81254.1 hypothetical protein MAR10_022 [Vibrio phage vB_VpaS_MAR10]